MRLPSEKYEIDKSVFFFLHLLHENLIVLMLAFLIFLNGSRFTKICHNLLRLALTNQN